MSDFYDAFLGGFNEEEGEVDYEDSYASGFGEESTETGYNRGYAEGATYVASEIEEVLGCERYIDCDCNPHKIIRRVLLGAA